MRSSIDRWFRAAAVCWLRLLGMDAEPEPSAPHPAEAATPLASRFSATRARIVAKGCLGARLIVDGEQELGPGVPLSHSAVELRDDAGLVKITVSPGQHPSFVFSVGRYGVCLLRDMLW